MAQSTIPFEVGDRAQMIGKVIGLDIMDVGPPERFRYSVLVDTTPTETTDLPRWSQALTWENFRQLRIGMCVRLVITLSPSVIGSATILARSACGL